jgi:predicted amidophosphoribosyltransferase
MDFSFQGVIALWSYHGLVCDAVIAAKFAHRCPLGDALGRRLGAQVASHLRQDPPEVVTYVPSHVLRQLTRGGNGNQAIAEAVASRLRKIGLPVKCRELLKTTRRIAKQAWLDDQQRQENVRGAFALRTGYSLTKRRRLTGQHVLLVDDVLTTGATASEVSRVLAAAGARRTTLAVVARALRTHGIR